MTCLNSLFADLDIFVEHIKFVRKISQTEPFKSGAFKELDPGPECVTDEQMKGKFPSSCP